MKSISKIAEEQTPLDAAYQEALLAAKQGTAQPILPSDMPEMLRLLDDQDWADIEEACGKAVADRLKARANIKSASIIQTAAPINGVFPYATLPSFWDYYYKLPIEARKHAVKCYTIWCHNPGHPSLQSKRLPEAYKLVYTVRVDLGYRSAAYVMPGGVYFWFYVGPREDLDKIISNAKGGGIKNWWQTYKSKAFTEDGTPLASNPYHIVPTQQQVQKRTTR